MTVKKRSLVMAALIILALALHGAARYYAPSLVLYVVKQSLAQKAPSGTDVAQLHERLQALLSAEPDRDAQMERLLRISEYLEKVQHLSSEELNGLLAVEITGASQAQ